MNTLTSNHLISQRPKHLLNKTRIRLQRVLADCLLFLRYHQAELVQRLLRYVFLQIGLVKTSCNSFLTCTSTLQL
jgi:hypothetical protein